MLEFALSYAQKGWPIIPLHSCDGCFIGKEPLTERGFRDATTNEFYIKHWWERFPTANIGIRTGKDSGLVVVDIDRKNGGIESLSLLEEFYGRLPDTPCVVSGGGGKHFYFKHPGFELRGRLGMRPGIDVKADGGGITAPPSNHFSGKNYQWAKSPDDVTLKDIPDWLLLMIQTRTPKKEKTKEEVAFSNIFGDTPNKVADIEDPDLQQVMKEHPWLRVKG